MAALTLRSPQVDDDRIIEGQAPDSTTPTRRRKPVRSLAYFPGIRFDPNDGDGGNDGDGDGDDGGTDDTGNDDGNDDGGNGRTFNEAYVKKLRDEAAARRKRERELETRLAELEKRDLSEKERAEKERDEARKLAADAEQRARSASARAAIAAAAVEAKAVDVGTVQDLLSGKIEFDDDGEPSGVDEAVKALLDSKPFLRASTGRSGEGAAAGAGASGRSGGKLTKEMLAGMSPQQVAALDQAEVDRVLAG